ncbi:XRE family transcriptional regulator [Veillonella caviae]|uniref:XRE family transcriptional regulator n=1 Tax=Veillonella caviae TaxID=248316 RepID=UPI002A91A20B|nr:XRE family transcriptional regulator [Veillonella caviae]MDY6225355.1 XRE family transcriptional regulator [Veillonella caviae]
MIDKALLRYYAEKSKYSMSSLATELNMNPATMFRKLNGTSDFTRHEMQKIKDLLHLSTQEFHNIFFAS